MVRIRNIHHILKDVQKVTLSRMVFDFKRDLHIDSEIWIWEGIAAAYSTYRDLFNPSIKELGEVFQGLIVSSMGMFDDFLDSRKFKYLNREKRKLLLYIWSKMAREVEFADKHA
jgi:hypothetical protein